MPYRAIVRLLEYRLPSNFETVLVPHAMICIILVTSFPDTIRSSELTPGELLCQDRLRSGNMPSFDRVDPQDGVL